MSGENRFAGGEGEVSARGADEAETERVQVSRKPARRESIASIPGGCYLKEVVPDFT